MGGPYNPGMYCRACRYELIGIAPDDAGRAACPECGLTFTPGDPSTMARRAEPRGFNSVNPRLALSVLVGAALLLAFARTWLPRPALSAASGWALWEWMGEPYGIERVMPIVAGPEPIEVKVRWWGGAIRSAAATSVPADEPGVPLWRLARRGDNWSLELHRPDQADPRDLIYWFNSMRNDEEIFNIRIEEIAGTEERAHRAAEGDQAAIFTLIARTYGITVTPVAHVPGHELWAWNPVSERLERTSLTTWQARHAGDDLAPARSLPRVARHEWRP